MKNNVFVGFYKLAELKGIEETAHMGYMWIDLTVRQMNKMCDLAQEQGYEYTDGWIQLKNGLRIRHREKEA